MSQWGAALTTSLWLSRARAPASGFDPAASARSYGVGFATTQSKPLAEGALLRRCRAAACANRPHRSTAPKPATSRKINWRPGAAAPEFCGDHAPRDKDHRRAGRKSRREHTPEQKSGALNLLNREKTLLLSIISHDLRNPFKSCSVCRKL